MSGIEAVKKGRVDMERNGMKLFVVGTTLILGIGGIGLAVKSCLPEQEITVLR